MRPGNRQGWGRAAALLAVLLVAAPSTCTAAPAHGRTWELVTPGPTNGVKMLGARAWSSDGNLLVFATLGPMTGAVSGDLIAHGLFTRTSDGWTQQLIGEPFTVPTADFDRSRPVAISDDLRSWLWASVGPLLPGAPAQPQTSLYHRDPDGRLTLIGDAGHRSEFTFVGASDDLRHAVFQSRSHLLPADAVRIVNADVYEFVDGELRMVGVDSAGAAISACGSTVGSGDTTRTLLEHGISRDGARIFFSAPDSGECAGPRAIYLREDATHTIAISASACTRPDCNAPQDATFAGALPDGSSAFVVSAQQLTDDDVDETADLYRYDVADQALTRLSVGPPGAAANVVGTLVRASEDGTRVYFVASGALVPGEGVEGDPNLYLLDHGQLRYVATPAELDLSSAAMTADGRVLAFATTTPLVPGDTDASSDVYRYDVDAQALVEVSVGSAGSGNAESPVTFGRESAFGSLEREGQRSMSADGTRVVFLTSEPLAAEDANETPDVYEWVNGDTGLISSGAGDESVAFAGASADGRSVFFATDESLVPADHNSGDPDLYVARLGGGHPAPPPPPPPPCDEDTCQGAVGGRLERRQPDSVGTVATTPRLSIRPLGSHAKRRLETTGRVTILAETPIAGRVSAVAHARIRGRATVVAHVARTISSPGIVRLELRLSSAARRVLRHRSLRLTLVVSEPHVRAAPAMVLRLRSTA